MKVKRRESQAKDDGVELGYKHYHESVVCLNKETDHNYFTSDT